MKELLANNCQRGHFKKLLNSALHNLIDICDVLIYWYLPTLVLQSTTLLNKRHRELEIPQLEIMEENADTIS